jgi:oligopeptide/dipeptide ABC transporter ATP-binding protein
VEMGSNQEVFSKPLHPYTQALFSAIPDTDPEVKRERILLRGEISVAIGDLPACRFYTRCRFAQKGLCDTKEPELRDVGNRHIIACHMVE